MASKKTPIVEYLYDKLSAAGRSVALFDDVAAAIRYFKDDLGLDLSDNNPANFMKDFLRGMNASANWPVALTAKRITAKQQTGAGRIFEFIPFLDHQTEAFPNPFEPTGQEVEYILQSLSLSQATRSLGRDDESWLIQVSVWLRVLETHFSKASECKLLEVSHLQNGIKLNRTEIDALFLGVQLGADGNAENVLITCEAKQQKDPILGDQIVRQVASALQSTNDSALSISKIIPIAIKAIKDRAAIYVAEFEPWSIAEASIAEADRKDLILSQSAIYRLVPPVPGIGFKPKRVRKKARQSP